MPEAGDNGCMFLNVPQFDLDSCRFVEDLKKPLGGPNFRQAAIAMTSPTTYSSDTRQDSRPLGSNDVLGRSLQQLETTRPADEIAMVSLSVKKAYTAPPFRQVIGSSYTSGRLFDPARPARDYSQFPIPGF